MLGLIVILASFAVMYGWFFDIPVLKSILPGWVAMKFITALCFLFSGLLVFLLASHKKSEASNFFILIFSFVIFLIMASFLLYLSFGMSVGIENLFVKEPPGAVRTVVPGVPAVPTIISFILIAMSGLFASANLRLTAPYFWLGALISAIGGIAVVGYLANIPVLYYSFEGFTSMAFHTAMLFVLIGISLILTGKENKKHD